MIKCVHQKEMYDSMLLFSNICAWQIMALRMYNSVTEFITSLHVDPVNAGWVWRMNFMCSRLSCSLRNEGGGAGIQIFFRSFFSKLIFYGNDSLVLCKWSLIPLTNGIGYFFRDLICSWITGSDSSYWVSGLKLFCQWGDTLGLELLGFKRWPFNTVDLRRK